jgi:hypothetical protein
VRNKLRDPIWQLIIAVVSVLLTVVSGAVSWLAASDKSFGYVVLAETPLVRVQDEIDGRLQILLDGKPITDTALIILRVQNTGNVPILRSDFDSPVTVSFRGSAEILNAEVLDTSPKNPQAAVQVQGRDVVLSPVLLNGGDVVDLKIVLSEYRGIEDVGARIVGVNELTKIEDRTQLWPNAVLASTLAGVLGAALGMSTVWALNSISPSRYRLKSVDGLVLILFATLLSAGTALLLLLNSSY